MGRAYINPGGLEVVPIGIRNGAECFDGLNVLWFHFCQSDRRGEHRKLGQRLDIGITLQLCVCVCVCVCVGEEVRGRI